MRSLTGLCVIAALVAMMFFDAWWLFVIGSGLCVLTAGLNERLVNQLEAENDRLRSELAQYKAASGQGRETPDGQASQFGDAFLQSLQASGQSRGSSASRR
jgi:hypothetical protein